jgi:shikimate 5-dehydrogenase
VTSYLIGLVGSGIGPSASPALHEREADELGLRYVYRLLDLDVLRRPVADVIAAARWTGFDETALLAGARARGCRVLHGGGMVVLPAAESFRLFTGAEPDPERMLRHFDVLEGETARAA